MRLLVGWQVRSPRLTAWLEQHAGCPHCGCATGRLVRHVITSSHTQVWIACLKCSAKLGGGPQPHIPDHVRFNEYSVWNENMGAHLQPEEFTEIERARPRPLTWGELNHELRDPRRSPRQENQHPD